MKEIVRKIEIEPCPSCTDPLYPCNKYMLSVLMTDSRMDKDDARRLVASWNYFRDIDLETLERISENKTVMLEEEERRKSQ